VLARPFSRPNWALTIGSLVYGLISTFFRVPIGCVRCCGWVGGWVQPHSTWLLDNERFTPSNHHRYYVIQNLKMNAAASNVCSTMMVRVWVYLVLNAISG
jgi:hypothetical protein